jgi:hypothetical protein
MIVTITGAFKNAGDYLIGDRARKLIRAHVDADVVDINRKSITDVHYDLFNKSRVVLLTGGPAYQKMVYPKIYPIDLDRINVPVIPFGLGWKGKLDQLPQDFEFTAPAADFVKRVHTDQSRFSSARDFLTVEVLGNHGVENVEMTGCPAWYDESKLNDDFVFNKSVKVLVFSMPAMAHDQVPEILAGLAKRFPKAKKYISFQAGFKSTHSTRSQEFSKWNRSIILSSLRYGYRPISFESNFEKFTEIMSQADFHIGYRVHSHIFCLSQRKSSVLIAEDSRGVGQAQAMGGQALLGTASSSEVLSAVDDLFNTRGVSVELSINTMRGTHQTMIHFLNQLKEL